MGANDEEPNAVAIGCADALAHDGKSNAVADDGTQQLANGANGRPNVVAERKPKHLAHLEPVHVAHDEPYRQSERVADRFRKLRPVSTMSGGGVGHRGVLPAAQRRVPKLLRQHGVADSAPKQVTDSAPNTVADTAVALWGAHALC